MLIMIVFFNDTATTEIYTLSLHDALPISQPFAGVGHDADPGLLDGVDRRDVEVDEPHVRVGEGGAGRDRKSTRLNSSHANISYAVFCLKKKKLYLITSA